MDPDLPLSKNAQKKVLREARFAEYKLQRRAKEKEARKEKKRIRAEKRAAGQLDEDDVDDEQARLKKKPRLQFGARVVVDLAFDHLMSEKEIKSLCSQLAYTYSANRAASHPFSLLYTSLGGRTLQRLESLNDAGYKRWSKTEWWTEGYERLWNATTTEGQPTTETASNKTNVIYLTADSDEEISELKPDQTYIIGGIVDHNQYKFLCQNKAKESDIRTARLPIGRYLANLPTRKVLTVNQVFEILIQWVETKDWEAALNHVMPKRKFLGEGRHGKSKQSGATSGDSNEDGDDPVGNDNQGTEEAITEEIEERGEGAGEGAGEGVGEELRGERQS